METFGQIANRSVQLFRVTDDWIAATVIDCGGALVSLEVPDRGKRKRHVVLGFDNARSYAETSGSFGALPTGEIDEIAGTSFDSHTPHVIGERIRHVHPQLRYGRGYDHYFMLPDGDTGGVRGRRGLYRQSAGFAVEPQGFPDAPNRPIFPSTILRTGDWHHEEIVYRFSILGEHS